MEGTLPWTVFAALIALLLLLDARVVQAGAQPVGMRHAAIWTSGWVAMALVFGIGIFLARGADLGTQFLAGYLIELSLSADNVLLFAVIFAHFQVPPGYQQRVLLWGIAGAVVMRIVMIIGGAALLHRFQWVTYLLGGLLVITGLKVYLHRNRALDAPEGALTWWLKRHLRLTDRFVEQRFVTRIDGKLYATRLFLVMAVIGSVDPMFAVDSIPAVFAVSTDPFIVITSNMFAILGLRPLYFIIAGGMQRAQFLKPGLAVILAFVGLKMLGVINVSVILSLGIVAAVLLMSVLTSIAHGSRRT